MRGMYSKYLCLYLSMYLHAKVLSIRFFKLKDFEDCRLIAGASGVVSSRFDCHF